MGCRLLLRQSIRRIISSVPPKDVVPLLRPLPGHGHFLPRAAQRLRRAGVYWPHRMKPRAAIRRMELPVLSRERGRSRVRRVGFLLSTQGAL